MAALGYVQPFAKCGPTPACNAACTTCGGAYAPTSPSSPALPHPRHCLKSGNNSPPSAPSTTPAVGCSDSTTGTWSAGTSLLNVATPQIDSATDSGTHPTGKHWWYTHDRLPKAYNLLAVLQQHQEHLFAHLSTGAPKTTSPLEGGINALIKNTLRLHCGMPEEHQKRAAEWVLSSSAPSSYPQPTH
jgi:hypothetical protein